MTDSKPMRAELVDDYRIKCALLLEEVIDAEEAAKLAAAEIAELRAERDRLKAALVRLGSVEAFTSSQGICPELYERITYARKELGDAS